MSLHRTVALAAAIAAALVTPPAAAEERPAPVAELAETPADVGRAPGPPLAVAPFELVGAPGASLPDVATLLADRLGTQGFPRVVGPAAFAAPALAEPEPEAVVGWAAGAGVEWVVAGRVTRLGEKLSIDVRLLSGETGQVYGTYVAEAADGEALGPSLEVLAARVGEGAREARAPAVALPGPAARAGNPAPAGGGRTEILGFDSDAPFEIHADQLEAVQDGGARSFRFAGNVRVAQRDARIYSDRLDAFYPPAASQPERMVAQGHVRLVDGDREARCDEATYRRSQDLLVCTGNARLCDGEDRVDGEVIEFDLAADTVVVKGGARVVYGNDGAPGAGCGG